MRVQVLSGLHWVAKGFLKARGFRWEVRRNGDVKLGYWKKTLKAKDRRKPYPKRFVLIPGFGDTPLSWYPVVELLHPFIKGHFDEIILMDFPGFGGFLARERSFPSMDFMMTAVSDALDSLKPDTLLGHSLGGWLAAHYAGLCGTGIRPQARSLNYTGPRRLLLINPSGVFPNDHLREEWGAVFQAAVTDGFKVLRPHLFAKNKEPFWFKWIENEFAKFLLREDIHQFMGSVKEHHFVAPLAQKIRSEVWLLWGEKDTLTPASWAKAWIESLKGGNGSSEGRHSVVIIKDSGHSPHLETPGVTASVIGQILFDRKPHHWGKRWWRIEE